MCRLPTPSIQIEKPCSLLSIVSGSNVYCKNNIIKILSKYRRSIPKARTEAPIFHSSNIHGRPNLQICFTGSVERVKKIRDYAFVHFNNRDDALEAMKVLNGKVMLD